MSRVVNLSCSLNLAFGRAVLAQHCRDTTYCIVHVLLTCNLAEKEDTKARMCLHCLYDMWLMLDVNLPEFYPQPPRTKVLTPTTWSVKDADSASFTQVQTEVSTTTTVVTTSL